MRSKLKFTLLALGACALVRAHAKVEAGAAEGQEFTPTAVKTLSLPPVTAAPTAGTVATPINQSSWSGASPAPRLPLVLGGTPTPATPVASQPPPVLIVQPVTLQPQLPFAPIPNISSNTMPMIAAFISAMAGGSTGGRLPPNSAFYDPRIGADGIPQNPWLYGGTASDYTNATTFSPADAAIRFPGPGFAVIPGCNTPSGGALSQIPTNSGAALAGHTCSNADRDRLTCMVCNLQFEAGNQGEEGMTTVVRSVMSRVFNSHYPDTVCKVVYQGNGRTAQYSWTYEHKNHQLPGGAQLDKLIRISQAGMNAGPNCYTNYFNQAVLGRRPDWALTPPCANTTHLVQDHTFCEVNGQPDRRINQVAAAEQAWSGSPARLSDDSGSSQSSY